MSLGLDVTTGVLVPSAVTPAAGANVSGVNECCTCAGSGTAVLTSAAKESPESSSDDTDGVDRS